MRRLKRITVDPRVMGGKPCIRSMRITVGTIVSLIGAGRTTEEVLDAYPSTATHPIGLTPSDGF